MLLKVKQKYKLTRLLTALVIVALSKCAVAAINIQPHLTLHANKLLALPAGSLMTAALIANDTQTQNQSKSETVKLQALKGHYEDKQALRKRLSAFANMQASFDQSITDIQGNVLQTSAGKIIMEKPQKLVWEVLNPEESLLIADSEVVYNIDPFTEQVTLLDQHSLTDSNPLMLLVSDDLKQWDKVSVSQHIGKENTSYNVVSRSSNSPVTAVTLVFDAQNKLINLISIDRQQQQNNVQFNDVEYNTKIPKDAFLFHTPEGWIIDDQRSSVSAPDTPN